jgi:hypothetical protein
VSTSIAIRPRSVSELVDAAFQVLRGGYAQYVMLMGLAYVPWLIVIMITSRSLLTGAPTDPGAFTRSFVLSIGGMIWFSVIDGAMTVAASQGYLGQRVDVGAAFGRALSQIGALVGVAIARVLLIFIGLVLLIAPGLYFLARYAVAPAAAVIERAGLFGSMGRASALSDGFKWHVLKTLLLVWVIYLVLSTALVAMLAGAVAGAGLGAAGSVRYLYLTQIVSALFTILVYPLVSIVQTLLYYDLRIRKEAYDIELMASGLGGTPSRAA